MALASVAALVFRNGIAGGLIVGMVWTFEMLTRSWFTSDARAAPFFLFLGARAPYHPALVLNQVTLVSVAVVLIVFSPLCSAARNGTCDLAAGMERGSGNRQEASGEQWSGAG
jgi:ABC-type spermidine/putrescine transport system permease subunit II